MMLLPKPVDRLRARVKLASSFARCGIKVRDQKPIFDVFMRNSVHPLFYVGLSVVSARNYQRIRFSGLSSLSFTKASEKAFSEYLEATTIWDNQIPPEHTRSGWACHRTKTLAIQTAYRELIERDSFLMHFLCPRLQVKRHMDSITIKGHSVRLVQLQSLDSNLVVFFSGLHIPNKRRWLLGLGCASDTTSAKNKSIEELQVLFFNFLPYAERKDRIPSPHLEHFATSGLDSAHSNLQTIFLGGGNALVSARTTQDPIEVQYYRVFSKHHHVVGITHAKLLELKFGTLWKDSWLKNRAILLQRGLEPREWLVHPFL